MKTLTVVGTAAMFMVGGGISTHGLPLLHHWIESLTEGMGGVLSTLTSTGVNIGVGVVLGAVVLLAVMGLSKVMAGFKK